MIPVYCTIYKIIGVNYLIPNYALLKKYKAIEIWNYMH